MSCSDRLGYCACHSLLDYLLQHGFRNEHGSNRRLAKASPLYSIEASKDSTLDQAGVVKHLDHVATANLRDPLMRLELGNAL